MLTEQALPERGLVRGVDPVFLASVQTTRRVRVDRVDAVGEGSLAFTLVPVDGHPLPRFEAGAHIPVHCRATRRFEPLQYLPGQGRPLYVCGPAGFLDAAEAWAVARG